MSPLPSCDLHDLVSCCLGGNNASRFKLIYKYIQSLQVQSKQRCVWCCGCGHRATHDVMGTVVMPHIMSHVLLSCCVLCCRHYHHATFCVAGAVIVWLWWALCCGHVCCMAAVGVIVLYCVVVGVVAWS